MHAGKTVFRFVAITLYFALMAPFFALCALVADDALTHMAAGEALPSIGNYVFAIFMYWPSAFRACLVPCTVVGYAYASFLFAQRHRNGLRLTAALPVAALLGLASGSVLGWSSPSQPSYMLAGAVAGVACAAVIWFIGLGTPVKQ